MDKLRQRFEQLINVDVSEVPVDSAITLIGELIDLSWDLQEIGGLNRSLGLVNDVLERSTTKIEEATLHYFSANAYSHLRYLEADTDYTLWLWEQERLEKEVISLRMALRTGGTSLPPNRMCQIYTNLGNAFSHIGRIVEALELWNNALSIDPNFGMAMANRGSGYLHYARVLYRNQDIRELINAAKSDIENALSLSSIHFQSRGHFEQRLDEVRQADELFRRKGIQRSHKNTIGRSNLEKQYRLWAVGEKLFLNHVNDIHGQLNAVDDNLMLPNMVRPIQEAPHFHSLFNQLKQEYVTARFMYFEGINHNAVHFSDRRVTLYNTLDYQAISMGVEKVKMAYRMAYSIFDKVAFFLNHYLDLRIEERKVAFKTCWYMDQSRKKGLRTEFFDNPNWPLRGLFWLSKDLYESKEGFHDAIEPDAKDLAQIRNHLEHKYLKVHQWGKPRKIGEWDMFFDELAYSVGRTEFNTKTLRLLRLVRAALIYLSLSVHTEEHKRTSQGESRSVFSIEVSFLKDDWKL